MCQALDDDQVIQLFEHTLRLANQPDTRPKIHLCLLSQQPWCADVTISPCHTLAENHPTTQMFSKVQSAFATKTSERYKWCSQNPNNAQ